MNRWVAGIAAGAVVLVSSLALVMTLASSQQEETPPRITITIPVKVNDYEIDLSDGEQLSLHNKACNNTSEAISVVYERQFVSTFNASSVPILVQLETRPSVPWPPGCTERDTSTPIPAGVVPGVWRFCGTIFTPKDDEGAVEIIQGCSEDFNVVP